MSVGRGVYHVWDSAQILDDQGNQVLDLAPNGDWIVRGFYETDLGDLATMVGVPPEPTTKQLKEAKRKCRQSAVELYEGDA